MTMSPLNKDELLWKVFNFDQLNTTSLYDIINLRCRVFVAEQNIPYVDPDYKDQKALHLCGFFDGKLVAYSRLFRKGDYLDDACIGRVLVDKAYRMYGYGHDLMKKAIAIINHQFDETVITISAQLYLRAFYEKHGFVQVSDPYLEDTIPHIRMTRK